MQQLIEKIKKKDRKAQEALYKKYADAFFHTSFRYLGNEMDAAEALNNAFLKIFEKISVFQFINNKAFEGWMYRILINEALMFLRERNNNVFQELEKTVIETNSSVPFVDDDYLFILQKLPDGYRTIFNLYAIEGYSHQEIAEQLDITESTSRSQLSRAREILKKLIEKDI